MNDFTKEELQYLVDIIGSIGIAGHRIDDVALGEKLQSMIDNYSCKHLRFSPTEALNMPLHCLDCGEKFE